MDRWASNEIAQTPVTTQIVGSLLGGCGWKAEYSRALLGLVWAKRSHTCMNVLMCQAEGKSCTAEQRRLKCLDQSELVNWLPAEEFCSWAADTTQERDLSKSSKIDSVKPAGSSGLGLFILYAKTFVPGIICSRFGYPQRLACHETSIDDEQESNGVKFERCSLQGESKW